MKGKTIEKSGAMEVPAAPSRAPTLAVVLSGPVPWVGFMRTGSLRRSSVFCEARGVEMVSWEVNVAIAGRVAAAVRD